jgi:hypothetical protein
MQSGCTFAPQTAILPVGARRQLKITVLGGVARVTCPLLCRLSGAFVVHVGHVGVSAQCGIQRGATTT